MGRVSDDQTIGMPAIDIERVSLLQRRYDFIEAYEVYKKQKLNRINASLNLVRARLISFFLQMQAMIKRRKSKEVYEEIERKCFNSVDEGEIIGVFCEISEDLDRMNLTKIDTKKDLDRSLVENENEEAGL